VNQPTTSANSILLYDGVCGLCNHFVQFCLRHDKSSRLRFASLQSGFAARVLQRHAMNPADLDSLYLVEDYEARTERISSHSDAVISALRLLSSSWFAVAAVLRIVPRRLRDWGYRLVARNRYRIFGRSTSCILPEARYRNKFLDQ